MTDIKTYVKEELLTPYDFEDYPINLRGNELAYYDDEGEIICGVVYDHFGVDELARKYCYINIASTAPWSTQSRLEQVCSYPFNELGVDIVCASILPNDQDTKTFGTGLGFSYTGLDSQGYEVWEMSKSDCNYYVSGT